MSDRANLDRQVNNTIFTVRIIAFAFAVSTFMFPLLVSGMVGSGQLGPGMHDLPIAAVRVLMILALALLLLARRVSQIPLQAAVKRQAPPRALIAAYMLSVMLYFMLLEGAAILGLMISIMSRNLNWCVGLGLAALFLMAKGWPKTGELELLLSSAQTSA